MRVEAVYVPFSREALIDLGLATEDDIRAEAEERATREARWKARPWYERAYIRAWYGRRRYELIDRLRHASKALRGIDCEY